MWGVELLWPTSIALCLGLTRCGGSLRGGRDRLARVSAVLSPFLGYCWGVLELGFLEWEIQRFMYARGERLQIDNERASMGLGAWGSACLGRCETWKYEGAMVSIRLYLVLLDKIERSQREQLTDEFQQLVLNIHNGTTIFRCWFCARFMVRFARHFRPKCGVAWRRRCGWIWFPGAWTWLEV